MARPIKVFSPLNVNAEWRLSKVTQTLEADADAHLLAVYQDRLWFSIHAGIEPDIETIWIPISTTGMAKGFVKETPGLIWSFPNVFGSKDVVVSVYDEDGHLTVPPVQVTEATITVTHTEPVAGRVVVLSGEDILQTLPDSVSFQEVATQAALPAIGDENVIYLVVDIESSFYWNGEYRSLGSKLAVVDNLTSTSTTAALSANQGTALKALVDNLQQIKVDTTDDRLSDTREWSAATVSQADAQAGISTSRFAWTPQRVFQAITAWWATVTLTKSQVGLPNVDNTSDANKPVSTAQQTALNLKLNIAAVVNNLTAGGTAVPLSAEQGKVLKGLIDTINSVLQSDDGTLDELQEIVDYIKLNRSELDALNIASIAGLQAALDAKLNANHASVTNSREWSEATVSQVEAEAGTATSRRAWTAQRVFQATAAWWNASAMKTKLDGIATGAQVNVPTDLTIGTRTTTTVPVTSSTGSSATIPVVTTSLAGVMSSVDKTKLDGIAAGAQVNVGTNLGIGTRTHISLPITSSTGTEVVIPVASTLYSGVMSGGDKSKLDSIDAGAQANVPTNLEKSGNSTTVTISSSTGGSAIITAATSGAAGVLTATDKTKLDGIAAGAQVNVATNLAVTTAATTLTVTSSTGTNATLPAATTSLAGMLTGADKTSLEAHKSGISAGTLLDKYSLLLGTSTGAVNLSTSQVWKITDPGSTRTVAVSNPPAATRSMSVVLQMIGNRATNWPAGVQWADGLAPVLAANWTMIILTYIDGVVYGSVGPSA